MSRRERQIDFEKHAEETSYKRWYNQDSSYRRKGPEGREWKDHKYIFKQKSPSGYMRYYYEVPSEVKGHKNVAVYYEDSHENKRAMREGGDPRRELTNDQLENIEDRKNDVSMVKSYLNDIPEDIADMDIDGVRFDIEHAVKYTNRVLSAYGDELVSNLVGIKNDVKDFFDNLFK